MSWANITAAAANIVQPEVPKAVVPRATKRTAATDKQRSTAASREYFAKALAEVDEIEFNMLGQVMFNTKFTPASDGKLRGWDLGSFKVGRVLRTQDQLILMNGPNTVRLTATANRNASNPSIDGTLDLKGDVITYIIEQPLTDVDRLRIQKYNTGGRGESNMDMKKYAIHFDDDTFEVFFAITKYGEKDRADLIIETSFDTTKIEADTSDE